MRRDSKAFKERFKAWKNGQLVYENGRPIELSGYKGGKDKIDWQRWDNAELTSYFIPYIKLKEIKLSNAGRATGAILSTNVLDSIADNAVRAGLPVKTAMGIAVKESTLGNPTDDRTAWKLSSGIRNAFNGVYPGTEQHINYWGDGLNEREDLINYHKGIQTDDESSKGKSVLQEAFEFYRQHPDKYNTYLKDYQQAVDRRANELYGSPEFLGWLKERIDRQEQRVKSGEILKHYVKPVGYRGGKDEEDVDYTIKKGDTLWGIAKKFTGDPSNYIKIAKANLIKNPDLIYTGDVLTIPNSLIINNQKTTNSENKVRHNNKNTTPIDIITDKSNADKIVRNFISNNELHLNDDFTNYKISKIESSNRIKNKQTNDYKSNNVDIPAVSEFIENNKILFVPDKNLQQFLNYKKTDLAEQKTKTTNKTSLKLYELQQVEPFVPTKTNSSKKGKINYKLTINESRLKHIAVTHDYLGNSVNIINPSIGDINPNIKIKTSNPIGKIFTNLYNKIPEEYRAPIDILKSGNILGLISYINTAYDRKISNDYKGVKMNRLNVEKAKETPKYRLSEPSTFDVAQAQPQQRTGILGKSISYMNVPYDINVKDYKWHYRLRGDMNPVQHTYGMLAPIFHTMTSKDAPIPGSYNGIIFNPKTGQLSVEPDINKVPEGWLINNTWVQHFDVKGMRKDPNGNLIMVTPDNREYRHNFTTEYELTDGTRKQPNVFTDMNNRDPKTLGAKAGGHFFISAQPKKGNRQVRLVHGSLQHLSDAIDRLKANTNTDYVTVYPLDGGSFSMGYIPQKAINLQGMLWITIEPDELNKYQYQNSYGSSGFMPVESLPIIPDTTYIDNEINNGYKYGKDAILGFEGGKDDKIKEEDRFATTEMPELVVTAPRKYVQEYDQNGNPVYTTDYTKSMAYEGVRLSESKYQRWANRDKNASTYTDPIIKAAQIGIGAPLAVTTAPATIGSLFKAAGPLLTRPLTTVTEAASEYLPVFSRTLPYTEIADRGLMGYMGARGVYDAGKGWYEGEMPWYQAVPQIGLSGLMMADAAPIVSKGYNNIKLFNLTRKPNVPEEFSVFEPYVRTRIGDVEIDNPGLYYHQSDAGKAKNFVSTGRMRTPLEEYWLAKEEAGEDIPIKLRSGVVPGYPQDPGSAMFAQGKLWYGLTPNKPDLLVTAREMPIANKNASIMSDKASLKALYEQGSRRVTNDNIYTQGPHNRQNTSAYTWEPGYGYRRVVSETTPTLNWADATKTPKALMTPSVDYSSPIDTKKLFIDLKQKEYSDMISGHMKINPLSFDDVIMKGSPLSFINREHIGTEFPIPQEALLILINSTLPRMKAMRPWMNQQKLDEYLRGLIDTKYTEFPEEAFKIADPDRHNFAASYIPETDFINKVKGVDPIWAMPHEVRHRLDYFESLVEAEENYLEKAYGQIFKDIPNNYPELSGYKHMTDEMVTTNQDARTALLGEYHAANTDWQLQNKIIDRKSDDAIIAAIRNANGYGRRFIELLEKNNGITPERLWAIRDAMKYVGISSVPITVGSSMLPTNNETYNGFKHGKDSGIHIKQSHRGKFTALKKRTGHSASWFKAHGTPALKKMATFALNARKWKH